MTKKSKLTLFLTFVMTALLMLTVGFGLMQPTGKVMASTSVFEMENGASVRLVEGSSGIRFRVKMDEATKEKVEASSDAGMLIFPQKYLTADVVSAGKFMDKKVQDGNSVDNTKLGLYDYIDVDNGSEGMTVYQTTDGWYANGCITGILPANYDLDFAAIAYYFDGTDYVYASFDADFGRSITQVLSTTYLKDGATYGEAIDAVYGDWFGTQTNPIQINNKEDFNAFAEGIDDVNTYEGKYVNIEQNIDLGEGDGSEVTPIPATFAGTLTASENVKITYKSTTNYYVPVAETYTLTKGIYDCYFDISANMYTDKVVTVYRTDGSIRSNTTARQKEYFDDIVTDNDITSAIGYENAYNNHFFALNLGFDLESIAGAYDLTFKVMYNAISGVSYDESKTVYGKQEGNNTKHIALTDSVAFSETNANKWIEYKFDLEDAIVNQNRHLTTDGEPGFVRLVYCTNKLIANIYVADVQFVEKELEPINVTSGIFEVGVSASSQGVKNSVGDDSTTTDTTIANIAGSLPASATAEGVISVYRMLLYASKSVTVTLGDTISNYIEAGYTHLTVYIATNANTGTLTATSTLIGFTGITKGSENSNKWLPYEIELDSLQDTSVSTFTLFTTGSVPSGAATGRYLYVFAELVRK